MSFYVQLFLSYASRVFKGNEIQYEYWQVFIFSDILQTRALDCSVCSTSVLNKPMSTYMFRKLLGQIRHMFETSLFCPKTDPTPINSVNKDKGFRITAIYDISFVMNKTKYPIVVIWFYPHSVFRFIVQATARGEEGMTLFFVCCNPSCGHRWRD